MALKDRFSFRGGFGNGHSADPGPDISQQHHASRGTTTLRTPRMPRPSEFHLGVPDDYRVYNVTDDYSAGDSPPHDSELEWLAEGEPEDVEMSIVPTVTINPPRPRTLEAGYNEETGVLRIRFRDGAVYDYDNVDLETWQGLQAERASTGKWMARNGLGHLGSGTRVE